MSPVNFQFAYVSTRPVQETGRLDNFEQRTEPNNLGKLSAMCTTEEKNPPLSAFVFHTFTVVPQAST